MIEREQWKAVLEALLFASEEPVSLATLSEILELDAAEVEQLLGEVRADYEQPGRGLRLTAVAGGFRFSTRPDYHPWVKLLFKNQRTVRLSRAALQTLAILAYKQPVTAPEIEEIRGVEASSLLKNLLEKRLIKILGRKDVVGRPILYGTTQEFLIQFGLNDLDDLPSLEEFEELLKADLGDGEATDVEEAAEDRLDSAGAGAPAPAPSAAEPPPGQARAADEAAEAGDVDEEGRA